jgi:hypothetical protein
MKELFNVLMPFFEAALQLLTIILSRPDPFETEDTLTQERMDSKKAGRRQP